jgi:membrane-associated phospholipid phosphatase
VKTAAAERLHGSRGIASASVLLPRGWGDLARQTLIWLGFGAAYEVARGLADRGSELAVANAHRILEAERGLHAVLELSLQRYVLSAGGLLLEAVNYTYWLSQFAVVGLVMLWIYLRRYPAFLFVRDTVIVTNTLGLIGYVVVPTAPPRLLPGDEFVDTLAGSHLSHATDLVQLASNPYAAMPSLHAADALIVGVALALLVRPLWLKAIWLLWPCWVAVALMASGNHFWLDVAVGVALVALAVPLTWWLERLRYRPVTPVTANRRASSDVELDLHLARVLDERVAHARAPTRRRHGAGPRARERRGPA